MICYYYLHGVTVFRLKVNDEASFDVWRDGRWQEAWERFEAVHDTDWELITAEEARAFGAEIEEYEDDRNRPLAFPWQP